MSAFFKVKLMEDGVTGRIKLVNDLTGLVAVRLPRISLTSDGGLPEINHAGIYFLFGKEQTRTGEDVAVVYVGQADRRSNGLGILGRIKEHAGDPQKSFFDYAVALSDKADSWDAGILCHLERSFFIVARNANRFRVKNGNTPRDGGLSADEREELDKLIPTACQMLALLGNDFTISSDERIRVSIPGETVTASPDYRLKGTGFDARGRQTMNGFTVLRGSMIRQSVSAHNEPWIQNRRNQFSSLIDNAFKLRESIAFSSPSAAASFVMGHQASGWIVWKTEDGKTLRDVEQSSNLERIPRVSTEWSSVASLAKAIAKKYNAGKGAERIAAQLRSYDGSKAGPERRRLFSRIGIRMDDEGRVIQPDGWKSARNPLPDLD